MDSQAVNFLDLRGDPVGHSRIHTKTLITHQSFTAQFQQDSLVSRLPSDLFSHECPRHQASRIHLPLRF
ncbi:MAG: hypothetical protein DMG08_08450 [Acidobacteria bacterium]|nr:MAG: hypothetical protein DMG08_08450 [Acidobacteriota bacterium]